MTFRKPSKRQMLDSCAEVRDDDGIDPKLFFRKLGSERKLNRKTLQLCSQAADALNGLLVDCGDERLQTLTVISVEPAPDASRLLVTVGSAVPAPESERQEVLAALAGANGRLRAGVAEAVTRKRAPQLVFHYAAPFSGGNAVEESRP